MTTSEEEENRFVEGYIELAKDGEPDIIALLELIFETRQNKEEIK